MKTKNRIISIFLIIVMLLSVTSCDLIANLRGNGANNDENKDKDNGNTGDDGWVMPEDEYTSFNIGDEVKFDIDFTKISSERLGITPLRLTNTLDGIFTKEKNKETKEYDFYMNIGKERLVPVDSICEKLFACKGNKIFHTPLEYIIDAKELEVYSIGKSVYNALHGTVLEILDYGRTKYAVIDTCGQRLIAEYDGKPGDEVEVFVPVDKLTIKDKTIDITIV